MTEDGPPWCRLDGLLESPESGHLQVLVEAAVKQLPSGEVVGLGWHCQVSSELWLWTCCGVVEIELGLVEGQHRDGGSWSFWASPEYG